MGTLFTLKTGKRLTPVRKLLIVSRAGIGDMPGGIELGITVHYLKSFVQSWSRAYNKNGYQPQLFAQ